MIKNKFSLNCVTIPRCFRLGSPVLHRTASLYSQLGTHRSLYAYGCRHSSQLSCSTSPLNHHAQTPCTLWTAGFFAVVVLFCFVFCFLVFFFCILSYAQLSALLEMLTAELGKAKMLLSSGPSQGVSHP
jgi:hypothetical protein